MMGLCPFHDERSPVLLGRPPGQALPLLRLRGGGGRLRLRDGEGGARVLRGGGGARRPLRGRAAARAGGPAGGGPPPAPPAPAAAARTERRLLLELPLGVTRGRQGARVPRRARAVRGGAEGFRRRLRPQRLGQDPRRRAAGGLPGRRRCTRVGLVQRNQRGGEYDRFRSRIMFPIRDARGRTLGFGGRAMRDDQGAKYVNTAETDFFHKSQILYGLDRARAAMARANRAVVVEGYTDVIALHQAGVEGTVAVMGTAITPGPGESALGDRQRGRPGARRRRGGPGGDGPRPGRRRANGGCACASPRCRKASTRRK